MKSLADIECVIRDDLRFKSKLGIGEDAYTSLKVKNRLAGVWDVAGAATSGAAVASSATVASTFFAPTGIMGLLGLGTAVTPIGWVVAAAVATGGAYIGVRKWFSKGKQERVDVIPKFINTPVDVLALRIFELCGAVSLKIAAIDGHIAEEERECIRTHFINDWGYEPNYVEVGLQLLEESIDNNLFRDLANSFADFCNENPDCDYPTMTNQLLLLVSEIIESDGRIDEREEMGLDNLRAIFASKRTLMSRFA